MQQKKKYFFMGLFLAILGMVSFQASAERLYAVTKGSNLVAGNLLELHPVTGKLIQTIGSVGYNVNGLAYDATTSTLYGTTTPHDFNFPSGLISIDTTTGAITEIGAGGVHTSLGVDAVMTLAVNSGGELYSWSKRDNARSLVSWDKGAGTASIVGASGIETAAVGLAFDNADSLYLFDKDVSGQGGAVARVSQVNFATGAATFLSNFSPNLPNSMAHHGDFSPISNLYYGLDTNVGSGKKLLLIDAATQTLLSAIRTEESLHALAFSPEPSASQGECDGVAGINIQDVVCTIDKVLN